jgi:hypothetical protein
MMQQEGQSKGIGERAGEDEAQSTRGSMTKEFPCI